MELEAWQQERPARRMERCPAEWQQTVASRQSGNNLCSPPTGQAQAFGTCSGYLRDAPDRERTDRRGTDGHPHISNGRPPKAA